MLNKIYKTLMLSFVFIVGFSFVNSAKVYLSGETENLVSNCNNNIDIMIDTQGEEIFGAAVNIQYDRKNLEIVEFYLNESLNLPLNLPDSDLGIFTNAGLSIIRGGNFDQVGFSGLFKYGTLVVKNLSNIESTQLQFLYSGFGSTIDNMDVFRLGDARDILKEVEGKTFNFVQGECLHTSPDGVNQLDENYDFRAHLDKNLNNISNLEKIYPYKKMILQYWSYALISMLIIILFIIMYKKGMFKNIRILKNKENKND